MTDDQISRKAAIDAIKDFKQGAAEWRDEQEEGSDIWHRADSAIGTALEIGLRIKKLPSAQPELDEWCTDCKEYDQKRHCCPRYNRVIREARDALSVQPEQRWIPCSEKPDTDRNVFIARGGHDFMTVCIGHYNHDLEMWYEDRNFFAKLLYDGLYWCDVPPLPEPFREEGEQK